MWIFAGLDRILILIFIDRAQITLMPIANITPAVPVIDPALQNAIKQRLPFRCRSFTVFFYKFKHGVLNQVQGVFLIASSELGHAISPTLNAG